MKVTYLVLITPVAGQDRFTVVRILPSGEKPLCIGKSQRPRRFLSERDALTEARNGARADVAAASRLGMTSRTQEAGTRIDVYVNE